MRALVIIGLLVACNATAQVNSLENKGAGATVPAYRIEVVSPDDTFSFNHEVRAVWVGSGGDIRVTTTGGDTVTIVGVSTGTLLPIAVTKVWSTGTSATSIQVWW
jgi:hypothetical protein